MNIKSYFTEIWQEKGWWKSILLTGLITLIPILGQIYLLGWLFEIYSLNHTPKRAMLPFTPTAKILLNGLKLAIGVLVYFIPFLILSEAIGLLANFFYWTKIGWFATLIFNLLAFIRNISFAVGILAESKYLFATSRPQVPAPRFPSPTMARRFFFTGSTGLAGGIPRESERRKIGRAHV